MMLLFKLFGIEINLPVFFSFLFGMFIGLSIAFLIYLLIVLLSINKKTKIVLGNTKNIDEQEVEQLIFETENMFKDKDLQGKLGNIEYCQMLVSKLMNNIAKRFFPNSKRPLAELSIDEILLLLDYVSHRLDELLDKRGIRIFRSLKLSTILGFNDVAQAVADNEIIKATKKYKLNETWRAVTSVTNFINPVFWVRRFIVTKGQNILVRKICVLVIDIVGEETYKIYSKVVFDKEATISTNVEEKAKELDDEIISDVSKEASLEENIEQENTDFINSIKNIETNSQDLKLDNKSSVKKKKKRNSLFNKISNKIKTFK